MDFASLLQYAFGKVIETFSNNWPLLAISILVSAALKVVVDENAVARILEVLRLEPGSVAAQTLLKSAAGRLYDVALEAYDAGKRQEARHRMISPILAVRSSP